MGWGECVFLFGFYLDLNMDFWFGAGRGNTFNLRIRNLINPFFFFTSPPLLFLFTRRKGGASVDR